MAAIHRVTNDPAAIEARSRRRLLRALVLPVCASALLLAACTSTPVDTATHAAPTPRSTPRITAASLEPTAVEGRLVAAGRILPAALGTSPWKLVRGPYAHACPDTGSGLQFEWTATGPGSADLRGLERKAAAAYSKAQFAVGVDHVNAHSFELIADSDSAGNVTVTAQRSGIRIDATSDCLPRDPGDYSTVSPEPPVPSPSS